MKKCSRCEQLSVIKQGHQWLCPKHYRFGQMRANAKRNGKLVPSHEWLESSVPAKMICVHCRRKMNWRSRDGHSTTICLQHNRDGSLALICIACNTRHGTRSRDDFYKIPRSHKWCPDCKKSLPLSSFCTDNSGRWKNKKSICRKCSTKRHAKWVSKNRAALNEKRRKYYHRRIAEGRPIARQPPRLFCCKGVG